MIGNLFIKLTDYSGKDIIVNYSQILYIKEVEKNDSSIIYFSSKRSIRVKESFSLIRMGIIAFMQSGIGDFRLFDFRCM